MEKNMAARRKREESKASGDAKCVFLDERNARFNSLPRELDTFWQNDFQRPNCLLDGHTLMTHKAFNKQLGFTHMERIKMKIHGLLPFAVQSVSLQVERCKQRFDMLTDELTKHLFLFDLENTNRKLFYSLISTAIDFFVPFLNTSTTGFAVKNFSLMYTYARGIIVTIKDKGHVIDVLRNWPIRNIRCVLVTDGAEVLSMGDSGVHSMAVILAMGQQNSFLGGVPPESCLCVALDVGTDSEELLKNSLYVGLRKRRITGPKYDALFEEFMVAVMQLYGVRTLVMCKDLKTPNALKQLEKFRETQCMINGDLQCLAACGLAGLLAVSELTHKYFSENVILFYGTSSMNIGMARLCITYCHEMRKKIWFFDEFGLVVQSRRKNPVPEELKEFAQEHKPVKTLEKAIELIKPNVLVGSSNKPKAFTKSVLNAMEQVAEVPVIFAVSRPLERAECSTQEAFMYTKGRCVFIAGNIVKPFKYANKWYQPGNCTSLYVISGITLGIIAAGMTSVPDEAFCVVAERLSNLVWPNDLAKRNMYPPMRKLQCVNMQIAEAILTFAYKHQLARLWPQPENPMHYLQNYVFKTDYVSIMNKTICQGYHKIGTAESADYCKIQIDLEKHNKYS